MRIPGIGKLKRLGGRYGRHMMSRGLVLMYHRVHQAGSDPWRLNVSESHFAEHMQVLRGLRSAVSLADFHSAIRSGKLSPGAIAVTFDDGYSDNLLKALPLLAHHQIPATVFVTAGQSVRRREFWWDELERLVIQTAALPKQLEIVVDDQVFRWKIPAEARNESKAQFELPLDSTTPSFDHAQLTSMPQSRLELYFQIWSVLQCRVQSVQDDVLDYLTDWCAADPTPREANRVLTSDELSVLSKERLIDIGAHTMTHPQLTVHRAECQRKELHESKLWLESVCNRPVSGLAYPYGSQDSQTRQIARDIGYEFACTTLDATSWRFSDSFQIPRMTVLDWSGEDFEKQLAFRLTRPW